MRLLRIPTAIACLALIAAGSIVATAPAASAGLLDVQCEGTSTLHYSPGLTNTAKAVTINSTDSDPTCASLADPTDSSGEGVVPPFTDMLTCEPLAAAPFTLVQTWANGRTSTMQLGATDISTKASVEIVTSTGVVTSGEFTGDTVVHVVTFELTDFGGCDNPSGLTELSGVSTLTLTGV